MVVPLRNKIAPVVELESVWAAFGAWVHEGIAASRGAAAHRTAAVVVVILAQSLIAGGGCLHFSAVDEGTVASSGICGQKLSRRFKADRCARRA